MVRGLLSVEKVVSVIHISLRHSERISSKEVKGNLWYLGVLEKLTHQVKVLQHLEADSVRICSSRFDFLLLIDVSLLYLAKF